jgi:peptidoglycan/LPS O-acetylase OafA/YrhL
MKDINMVKSIHYLRGIAALFVVLFHLRGYVNNTYVQSNLGDLLFVNGAFGVDLFFVISGFIICFATQKRILLST